jgi:hypothetical protein
MGDSPSHIGNPNIMGVQTPVTIDLGCSGRLNQRGVFIWKKGL